MKKKIFTFLLTIFFILPVLSQTSTSKKTVSPGKDIAVSFGVNLPIGNFSSTHFIGMAVDVSPARHTFGLTRVRKFIFTYNGGFAYYLGKKETVSGSPYKYPGYSFMHAFAGLLYNPIVKTSISLTAGPAIGIYNSTTRFTIGSKLAASYFVNSKIAVGPGIVIMKEFGSDPLWVVSVKATRRF
ncbi:MAG: hypothetical protein SGI83_13965 [Bacteroidota bacterium]|nr:hypothetical protein [Bacteroidota bacterium]